MKKKPQHTRPWLVRYFASARFGENNWSSQGCSKELMNAKSAAVVHIIREQWGSAIIYDRYTDRAVCVLTRTKQGINIR